MKTLFVLLVTLLAHKSWGFPENVRHGYFTCIACHVSPSGGGVLTPYGKSVSSELMSTWGTAKRSGFFFTNNEDESKNPPWFRANAFLRGVQVRRDTPSVESARFIPMQADLETGVDYEKWAAIVALGFRSKDPRESTDLNEFFSRRHYVLYRATDSLALRAGKFMFSFGLNMPDHIMAIRRGLGWDQGNDSYNLETSYFTEKSSSILTWIDNSPEEESRQKDKGVALNQSFFVGEDSRLGISVFSGGQSSFDKTVFGPYWTWSLTKKLFLNSEFFYQNKRFKNPSNTEKGYATFHRLGYEAHKGIIPFIQMDRSYLDDSDRTSQFDSYGVGFQWLPYPHFEALTFIGKEKAYDTDATDLAWLMLHIYL